MNARTRSLLSVCGTEGGKDGRQTGSQQGDGGAGMVEEEEVVVGGKEEVVTAEARWQHGEE